MNTVIFRTAIPLIVSIMAVFSVYVTLRGHNEPGGGFIGGLIAASAIAIFGMAVGPAAVRRALKFHPLGYAGFGVLIAALSGLFSALVGSPFMTSQWWYVTLSEATVVPFSSPLIFDLGVYFAVLGTLSSVALSLEDDQEEDD